MIGRHVGRLGRHPFVLRLAPADVTALAAPSDAATAEAAPSAGRGTAASAAAASHPEVSEQYWEIEYQGRFYPWRPVHAEDELDLPRLIRGAMAYLQGDLRRHG